MSTTRHFLSGYLRAALCLCFVFQVASAHAQWSFNGSNIYFNGGSVGIGTTGPTTGYKLDLAGNVILTGVVPTIRLGTVATSYSTIKHDDSSTDDLIITNARASSGGIRFQTAGSSDRLTILNTGNVGIGTANPGYKLDVAGQTRIAVDHYESLYFDRSANANSPTLFSMGITYDTPNNEYFRLGHRSAGIGQNDVVISRTGNVGIGTTNPLAKLQVAGDIIADGNISAKYQDLAEWVPSSKAIQSGYVVIVDPKVSGNVLLSLEAYDTRVAGVVSESPGIVLGESGNGKVKVATVGRVKVKADATRNPIQIGDLLVTSGNAGMAMKSEPVDISGIKLHRPGTLLGKALEPLGSGTGEITVLLSLQ